jgi:predicted esterase
MRTKLAILVLTLLPQLAFAQRGPASLPASQAIPRATLDQMYRRELGNLYRAADAEKLYRANQLVETYFASASDRKQTIQAIESLQLDPNIIGRITRIRMDWPALSPGVYYINERLGPHDVRYFLGIPVGYDRTKSWPLVIKLPTADAFVTDPRPDAEQANQIYISWMTQELKAHPDAVLIMPLLNLDELWGPSYAGMNSVIQPMLHVANRCNIDPTRVYMIGHAMSAHATWNLALHYTTYFAAFEALAGGASADWQRTRIMNLRNVLPVVWHDANDEQIKVDSSRQLVQLLRGLKIDVDYVETRNVGHVPTDAIAEERYKKMRGRTRNLYPKRVSIQSNRPDTMFNRNDWVQIYQPMNPGQEQRLIFRGSGGAMMVYPAAYSVDATISNNTLAVTSRNVESVRFYVNDQMIDFARAVSVTFNRVPRFEKILTPSIEEMLKDQLFLGRGWRYYTAVIDVDLTDRPRASTRGAR